MRFSFCASLQPMHDDYDLRQEQLNKASLLSSKKFLENLLEKFITNVVQFFLLSEIWVQSLLTSEGPKLFSLINILIFFSGPRNRSSGHQLLTGLLDVCTLRPLQWNHRRATVWHAAGDGCLWWTHLVQTLPGSGFMWNEPLLPNYNYIMYIQ